VDFLQEQTDQLKEAGKGLVLPKPGVEACTKGMNHIIAALADIRLESVKHLCATSEPDQFERLLAYINTVKIYSFKIIVTLGDPEKHLVPIRKANELLDRLDIHIRLSRHVSYLEGQPVSVEQDLNALVGSMQKIRDSLESFSTSVKTIFDQLKNEDQSI